MTDDKAEVRKVVIAFWRAIRERNRLALKGTIQKTTASSDMYSKVVSRLMKLRLSGGAVTINEMEYASEEEEGSNLAPGVIMDVSATVFMRERKEKPEIGWLVFRRIYFMRLVKETEPFHADVNGEWGVVPASLKPLEDLDLFDKRIP